MCMCMSMCMCMYIYIYIYIYEHNILVCNYSYFVESSFFYLNYIFQMWLHLFNSFLVLYKVIKLPIICIIYLYYYFTFSNN